MPLVGIDIVIVFRIMKKCKHGCFDSPAVSDLVSFCFVKQLASWLLHSGKSATIFFFAQKPSGESSIYSIGPKMAFTWSAITGILWAKCWGLALADFVRDPSTSDSLRGSWNFVFFPVNNATISPISSLTSGRHNSALITKAGNSRPNGAPTGCLVSSIFTVRINSKSFPWTVRCAPEVHPPNIFAILITYLWYR